MSVRSAQETVYAYHQRTKHAFERYAAGPGHLDWATQPSPFREFKGAERVPLPLVSERNLIPYRALFEPGYIGAAKADLAALGLLFELSFGLSAWKVYGEDRWALRCNPSSGNLHPTEAYLITPGQPFLPGGVYHYHSHGHALERRCRADLAFSGCLVALSSVFWREAWKYGERAFRYCQHDVGHALGALNYAAAVLGWSVHLLEAWGDEDIAALLGLDREADFAGAEREAPDLLCWVGPAASTPDAIDIDRLLTSVQSGTWSGQANRLSASHRHDWPVIEEVHAASLKPRTLTTSGPPGTAAWPEIPCRSELAAVEVIRTRRSAQAFDGVTPVAADTLFRILDATGFRERCPPWSGWPWAPRVHLALFVHRVPGLEPGLYVFWRGDVDKTRTAPLFRDQFEWAEVGPESLPLFRLAVGDARDAARMLSCHQAIASDSAFSLGMLAEFDAGLREGPWVYRRLFWETGLIGQALYLEARAAGVGGTGIGCFFDESVHELLGLEGTVLQSLYHFTVGGPLVDSRLQTLPPYAHLGTRRPAPG
ncbi:SagB/ThcOx family dehydrogenase [Methylotetracoccus oryzae]|uniref:SagB/ThcOx family dehydrogenase n=1 Tax=Methylotetracoccus oryzae TaxID=1919059 RepID=UPI00111A3972|nr:SagB/ThcOx family dehydrogenase [Methylotetracoccus oryzae]